LGSREISSRVSIGSSPGADDNPKDGATGEWLRRTELDASPVRDVGRTGSHPLPQIRIERRYRLSHGSTGRQVHHPSVHEDSDGAHAGNIRDPGGSATTVIMTDERSWVFRCAVPRAFRSLRSSPYIRAYPRARNRE
jgi:hypothetical protein